MFRHVKNIMLLLTVVLFVSCKGHKILSKETGSSFDNETINKISKDFLLFDTFSSRMKIEGKLNGEKQKFKASLRIKRDSIIWISMNLITGLPVAKIVFEKDSVKILDRINDKLYIGAYSFLEKKYGLKLGYSLVESVLLNEISNCDNEGYKTTRVLNNYEDSLLINCVVTKSEIPAFILNYVVDKVDNKIRKTRISSDEKLFTINYSDFDKIEDKLFPGNVELNFQLNEKSYNLDIDFSKIHLNKKQKYPFKVSKKIEIIKY